MPKTKALLVFFIFLLLFPGLLLLAFGKELKQIIPFTPKKSTVQKMLKVKN